MASDASAPASTTCCTLVLRVGAGLLLIGFVVACLAVWHYSPKGTSFEGNPLPPAVFAGGDRPMAGELDSDKECAAACAPGERGPVGPKGDKGMRGYSGLDGEAGEKGAKGRIGSTGDTGPRGFSVKGEKGAKGVDCEPLQGPPGVPGPQGVRGPHGLHGVRGDKGDSGLPGMHGAPGMQGPPGVKGEPGLQGPPGPENSASTLEPMSDSLPRTCAELSESQPDAISGTYVIDPNAGRPDDAIEAYCDLEHTPRTCFRTATASDDDDYNELIDAEPNDGRPVLWMSSLLRSTWLLETYWPIHHQLPSLQAHSRRARQSLKYHCWNSVAYQSANGSYDQGLTLVGWNEAEVRADPGQRLHYDVSHDGCRESTEAAYTDVYFETAHPFLLPIIDVGLRDGTVQDGSDETKRFRIEMGTVCFY